MVIFPSVFSMFTRPGRGQNSVTKWFPLIPPGMWTKKKLTWLVGKSPTPLKNDGLRQLFSLFPIWWESHKNPWFQSPPTSHGLHGFQICLIAAFFMVESASVRKKVGWLSSVKDMSKKTHVSGTASYELRTSHRSFSLLRLRLIVDGWNISHIPSFRINITKLKEG